jgi:hypothetical protein
MTKVWETRNTYRILERTYYGKRPLRQHRRLLDIINVNLRKMDCEDWKRMELAQNSVHWRGLVLAVKDSSPRFYLLPPCKLHFFCNCIQTFRTESVTKYMLTTISTRSEATQRVMAAKLDRLTHKIAIQLHLVAESCTICSSRSRRPVGKLLDTPSYTRSLSFFHRSKLERYIQTDGYFQFPRDRTAIQISMKYSV